jgi:general secretion pathway protein M
MSRVWPRHPATRLNALQAQWQAHIAPRWQALSARERLAVSLALSALGVLLLWWIALAPALHTLRSVPAQRATLEAQLAAMRRQAAEAQSLRGQAPISLAQAHAALTAATERLGTQARLVITGDRATVTFTGIDGATLLSWLGEVRSAARARPMEAQLQRLGKAYDGTLSLSLSAASASPGAAP